MHKIPTISFNDLKNTNKDVLDFLTSSLENNGFFVINDHPINLDLIKRTFDIAEEMFNLPYEIKQKYHVPGTNGARGYTPYGIETALYEKVADLSIYPASMTKMQIKKNFGIKDQQQILH